MPPMFGFRRQQPDMFNRADPNFQPLETINAEVPKQDFGFRYPEENQSRPMLDAFRNLIQAPPQRQNPGVLRAIMAALAGGGTAFGAGAPAGIKVGTDVLNAPHERAMEDYGVRVKSAQAGAEIEGQGLETKNRFFRDYNQTRAHEIDAERDLERGQREDERAEREASRQEDISKHYDEKAKLDREEFEARKAGGYFRKYPPKYIAGGGSGTAKPPKAPTQSNMQKAESSATDEVLSRAPQWEKFVRRDPFTKRVTAIVGPGEGATGSDLVQFENFMLVRRALASRRLSGGLGLPSFEQEAPQQRSAGGGPDPDYEY